MKIALIGNMNNNGFALLRYFLELGVDASLFTYSDDGIGDLAHFCPEADTWHFEKWSSHITVLPFGNNIKSTWTINFTGRNKKIKKYINYLTNQYDLVIGSGVAPALFEKHNGRLDVFYPYSLGVEFLGSPAIVKIARGRSIRSLFYRYSMNLQKAGIQHARNCFNAEMGLTKSTLDAINKEFDRFAVPMVFNKEPLPTQEYVSTEIFNISDQLMQHRFVVFSHARMYWIRDPHLSEYEFFQLSKNSDWLLRGFSQFVGEYGCDAVLVLVEYGPDVQAAKALSTELGISNKVIWLPVLKRREIMYLLQNIDVGVGEFYVTPGTIWGGTGWEILASGKPFLQAFNFTAEGYTEQFGHPPPPILHADSPGAVAMQLGRMWAAPDERERIGRENAAWFNENNGISLALKWLTRIGALSDSKADL